MKKILILLCQCIICYGDNYSMTSRSSKNYHWDEVNDDTNGKNVANNRRINNNKATANKSFEYKANIIGSTPDNNNRLGKEVEIKLLE